ncbi:MAG TPA: chemotaxis protein, partial [Gammaproteobacteria bacterium]|nr:chemotaxis protein [Gammaproteobacteria bacterium]
MRVNMPVTQKEVKLAPGQTIVSKTNPKGVITYINRDFIEISGYSEAELIGQAHNLIRHPDMPQAAFKDLWATVQAGKPWRGMVKNRCKNGDHYWVSAFATPVSRNGKVVEYQSVRTRPQPEQIQAAEALHARMRDGRAAASLRPPALGLRARV